MASNVPILINLTLLPGFFTWSLVHHFRALLIIVSVAGHRFPNPCPDVVVEIYIYPR